MAPIQITEMHRQDLKLARQFAAKGMHLDRYVDNAWELYFYSKLATYEAFDPANIALGAYQDGRLVGFIFVRTTAQPCRRLNSVQRLYVRCVTRLIAWSPYNTESDTYDCANRQMFQDLRPHHPAAEITFFAVDPAITGQRIGSRLLAAAEQRLRGQLVYLYTDSACNYPFYFHRGFTTWATRTITLAQQDLTCYLLTKQLP